MKNKILEILKELKREQSFTESENYIDDGILDSFDVIELINILEREFDIVIDGMDILPEYFSSIDKIENLIKKSKCND